MKTIELEMPGNPLTCFLKLIYHIIEVQYNELIPWRVPDSTLYFTLEGEVVWSDRGLSQYTVKANPKGLFSQNICVFSYGIIRRCARR